MAAGKGTRMGGDRPKVLYEVADRPMLHWVIDACREAGVERIVVVVGYQGDEVRTSCAQLDHHDDIVFVEQTEQLGTGHAVMMAQPCFENAPATDVLVLAGDGPLIRGRTLARVMEAHRRRSHAATLATSVIDDPSGYGRVVRNASGEFEAIVEQKDATPEQLAIAEVNPSYYCFRSDALFSGLSGLTNQNAAGEYYITDVPGLLKRSGMSVGIVEAVPPEDVLSINDPSQLQAVDQILRGRKG